MCSSCCDLLRINYLCGRITNHAPSETEAQAVVICSELTTFAVESPTKRKQVNVRQRCDLLRINYLCGRITNELPYVVYRRTVVICSELTTFAVESPTAGYAPRCFACCDLLRINYLCGRITNGDARQGIASLVVICSELTTFAVESPTLILKTLLEHEL